MGKDVGNIRRYTFKLYPNRAQTNALDRQRQLHCALYNAALEERIGQWNRECQIHGRGERRGLTCYDQQKALRQIRSADPEYAALSTEALTRTLERLDLAFAAFMRRARAGAGRRAGFPKFRAADRFPGMGFKRHRNGWRFDFDASGGARSGRLYVKGVPGLIRARGRLPAVPDDIKCGDLLWRGGNWWLSLCVVMPDRARPRGAERGALRFTLIEEFAVVRTADAACGGAPEDVFFVTADGGITRRSQGPVSHPDAGAPDSRGDRRAGWRWARNRADAGAPDSRGDRRQDSVGHETVRDAGAPDSRGDRRTLERVDWLPSDAGAPDSRGDRRIRTRQRRGPLDAGAPDSRGDRRFKHKDPSRARDAGAPDSRGDRRADAQPCPAAGDAGAPDSRGDRRVFDFRFAGNSDAGAPDSRGDRRSRSPCRSAVQDAGAPDSRGDCGKPHEPPYRPDDRSEKIARLQRRMARCRRGSARYRRLRRIKTRHQIRAARRRSDALHVWTTGLARRFGLLDVFVPDLTAITRSGHGSVARPGAETAFKADFNRRVLAQGAGAAVSMLRYKLAERGGEITVAEDADPPAAIGNAIVMARQEQRKTARILKHAPRS